MPLDLYYGPFKIESAPVSEPINGKVLTDVASMGVWNGFSIVPEYSGFEIPVVPYPDGGANAYRAVDNGKLAGEFIFLFSDKDKKFVQDAKSVYGFVFDALSISSIILSNFTCRIRPDVSNPGSEADITNNVLAVSFSPGRNADPGDEFIAGKVKNRYGLHGFYMIPGKTQGKDTWSIVFAWHNPRMDLSHIQALSHDFFIEIEHDTPFKATIPRDFSPGISLSPISSQEVPASSIELQEEHTKALHIIDALHPDEPNHSSRALTGALTDFTMTVDGFIGAIRFPTKSEADNARLDDFNRFLGFDWSRETDTNNGAEAEYAVRPVVGAAEIVYEGGDSLVAGLRPHAQQLQPIVMGMQPGEPALLPGEHRMIYAGEIQHLGVADQTGVGRRLFGKNIVLRHGSPRVPMGEIGDYEETLEAEAAGPEAGASTATQGRLPFAMGLVSPNRRVLDGVLSHVGAEIGNVTLSNALSIGDIAMDIGSDDAAVTIRTRHYTGSEAPDRWSFLIESLRKTPLKGDANLYAAGDPRQETYNPLNGGVLEKVFSSEGELIATRLDGIATALGADDILDGFDVQVKSTSPNQPENTTLTFNKGTRVVRPKQPPLSIEQIKRNALHGKGPAEALYKHIDIEIKFPPVPAGRIGHVIDGTTQRIPQIIWEQADVNLSNHDIRRHWHDMWDLPDPDHPLRKDFDAFVENNQKQLRKVLDENLNEVQKLAWQLPMAWHVAIDDDSVIVLDVIRNVADGTVFGDVRGPLAKLEGDRLTVEVPAYRLPGGKDVPGFSHTETLRRSDAWWRDILEPDAPTQGGATNPLDKDWSGVFVVNGRVDPPEALPSIARKALSQLRFPVAWVDGQGATAVIKYDPREKAEELGEQVSLIALDRDLDQLKAGLTTAHLDDPDALGDVGLILTKANVLFNQNQVVKMDLEFWWQLPFFEKELRRDTLKPNFIVITGRWETDGGQDSLELKASTPNLGYPVGILDIERLEVNQIKLDGKKIQQGKYQWKVDVDGKFKLKEGGLLDTASKGRLKELVFSGLRFDMDNPFSDWKFPNFDIDGKLDIGFKGFKFDIKSLKFAKPPQLGDVGNDVNKLWRMFTFLGDLHFASLTADFPVTPIIKGALNIDWRIRGTGDFDIDFDFDPIGWGGLNFCLFNAMHVSAQADYDKSRNAFQGLAAVRWDLGDDGCSKPMKPGDDGVANLLLNFAYGDGEDSADSFKDEKYWAVAMQAARADKQEFDMGLLKAKKMLLLCAHRATLPGLREAILSTDLDAISRKLSTGSDWQYTNEYQWLAGIDAQELTIKGLEGTFNGADATLIMSDDGLIRIGFRLDLFGLDFGGEKIVLMIDTKTGTIGASITLPDLNWGAYYLDLGTVGFVLGPKRFEFDWGYPYHMNWSRAVKFHWKPPTWPIPVNAVEGGVMAKIGELQNGGKNAVVFGVAIRIGYTEHIGSRGGAFGAYVAGAIFLEGIVVGGYIEYAGESWIFQKGTIAISFSARGGLYVLGFRWDILKIDARAWTTLIMAIGLRRGTFAIRYEAGFEATFSICLTPCTCASGTIYFDYSLGPEIPVANLVGIAEGEGNANPRLIASRDAVIDARASGQSVESAIVAGIAALYATDLEGDDNVF